MLALGIRVWHGTWLTSTSATDLSAAVDVYGEWVDAAEEVAKDGGSTTVRDYAEASRGTRKDRDTANNSDDGHQYSGEGIVADDEY
jgi:transcription elongation factor Elf1